MTQLVNFFIFLSIVLFCICLVLVIKIFRQSKKKDVIDVEQIKQISDQVGSIFGDREKKDFLPSEARYILRLRKEKKDGNF